ncbi:discoidin domain-containing protein [Arcanobacterium hippocoleae]
MQHAPGNDDSPAWDIAAENYTVNAGSAQSRSGNEGPKELASDNDPSTYWHTAWGKDTVDGTTNSAAWYEFNLHKPTTVDGVRYLPRPGGGAANGKLHQVKILITKKDGTVTTVDHTFEDNARWQKVTFAAVEDVTKVRVHALTTAGSNASQANQFASAAELRITTVRNVERPAIEVDVDSFKGVIAKAEKLKEASYTPKSWEILRKALKAAKETAVSETPAAYDVALAKENLENALAALVLISDPCQPSTEPGGEPGTEPGTEPGGDQPGTDTPGKPEIPGQPDLDPPSKPGVPGQPGKAAPLLVDERESLKVAKLSETGSTQKNVLLGAMALGLVGLLAIFGSRKRRED